MHAAATSMDTTEEHERATRPGSARTPKPRRVPPGWTAPGPPGATIEVALGPDEELSWLTGDWRIVQRRDGHRWSLDDLVTAWVARAAGEALRRERAESGGEEPLSILDLGSGIGSVALMMAWCFPQSRVTGVEAQALSHALADKSARANAVEGRVSFVRGDLREVALAPAYDLVTGTPPYFDDPAMTRSTGVQKGPCRFEERGGIGDYLAAMERALGPGGRAVICHASRQRARVLAAIEASRLLPRRALAVIPKVGREALVDVFELGWEAPRRALAWETHTVRDEADQWTPAHAALRLEMGLPPRPPRADRGGA